MGKTEKSDNKSSKKQKHFWKDFKAELKKVIWPTRSQVVNNTIIVVVIVLIVTAIVFVLDLAFEALNTYGINPLKTLVQNSVSVEDDNNSDVNNNNTDNNDSNTDSGENNSEENHNEEDDKASDDTANIENVENAQ